MHPISHPPQTPAIANVARSLSFAGATPAIAHAQNPAPPLVPSSIPLSIAPSDVPSIPPSSAIQVMLRLRPLHVKQSTGRAPSQHPTCITHHSDNPHTVSIRPLEPLRHPLAVRTAGAACFRFSHVFTEQDSQEKVFERTTLPLIEGLFQGKSAVVLAYGVTGSGKTWTIQGTACNPGVLPRSLDVIINSIAVAKGKGLRQDDGVSEEVALLVGDVRRRGRAAEKIVRDNNYIDVDGDLEYGVFGSYLEVYNEQCFDLFEKMDEISDESAPPKKVGRRKGRRILKLKEDVRKEVYAEGLTEVQIRSGEDIGRLLEFGQGNRRVAHTLANECSSRSHAVFFITLKMTMEYHGGVKQTTVARLSIVDLAGSERSSKAIVNAQRLKESNKINSSLMVLGRCLVAMRNNQRVDRETIPVAKKQIVPFRYSKLTRLLQRCLESGLAVLIANASPALEDADVTIQALRCAALAQEISLPTSKPRVLADRTNLQNLKAEDKFSLPPKRKVRPTPGRQQPQRGVKTRSAANREVGGSIGFPAAGSNTTVAKLKKENLTQKKELEEQNATVAKLKKEITFLRMELEEEHCANADADRKLVESFKECDDLFRQNEKLRDKLAESEARIYVVEAEIREELADAMEKLLKKMQENSQRRMDEMQKEIDRLHKVYGADGRESIGGAGYERLSTELDRGGENARRLATRLARRASKAVFDGMKGCLGDEKEEEEESIGREGDGSEWETDDEEYIEESEGEIGAVF